MIKDDLSHCLCATLHNSFIRARSEICADAKLPKKPNTFIRQILMQFSTAKHGASFLLHLLIFGYGLRPNRVSRLVQRGRRWQNAIKQ